MHFVCLLFDLLPVVLVESWKFLGPSALLNGYRFIIDNRDTDTQARLARLDDPFSLFRCRGIMNCVSVCPKGLNPTKAIGHIRNMILDAAG